MPDKFRAVLNVLFPAPFSRVDTGVLVGAAAVIVVCGSLLYFDMTAGGTAGGEVIGYIEFKRNVSQRKYRNQVVWESLENRSPVYNNDTIRTGDLSEAVITLNSKATIELDQNSMIVLSFSEEKASINFEYGSINAKKADGKDGGEQDLEIQSEDKTIKIEDDSDLALNQSKEGGLDVVVNKGEAKITTEKGEEQTVGKDERASLKGETIQVQKILLKPAAPGSGERFFVSGGRTTVNFAWAQAEAPVTLQVATDRGMGGIVAAQTSTGTAGAVALGEGVYYWRLTSRNAAGQTASEVRRFSVVQNEGVSQVAPGDGTSVQYATEPPRIAFAWSENSLASSYRLEVARDAGFGSVVAAKNTRSTSMGLVLEEGEYYWRVKSESNMEGGASSSGVRRVVVTREEQIAAPEPLSPSGGQNIPAAYFNTSGVNFSWSTSREIVRSQLQVARDGGFGNIVVDRTVGANFASVKGDFPEGRYFWRVRGTARDGRQTEFSAVASFEAGAAEQVELVVPASGAQVTGEIARSPGIDFRWRKPRTYATFELLVAGNAGFSGATSQRVTGLGSRLQGLGTGDYFWKVRMLDEKGVVLSESETRTFSVTDELSPPIAAYPTAGATVDLRNENRLNFRWNTAGTDVEYEIRLLQNGRVLGQTRTRALAWNFGDTDRMENGAATWMLRSCRGGQCTDFTTANFTLVLDEELDPPQIISPGTQYVQDD